MPIFSFGLLADLHYSDIEPLKDRYFRDSIKKFDHCVETMNNHSLEFVVDLGDLIDQDYSNFDVLLPHFRKFNSKVHFTVGNHDFEVEERLKNQVRSKIGYEDKAYYSFSIKHIRFVVLDGNTISTYANMPGTNNYIKAERLLQHLQQTKMDNAHFWNGAIDEEQLEWFELNLQEAKHKLEKVIVFCHFPVYPTNKHNLGNDSDLLNVIGKHDHIIAWISGHNHSGNYGYNTGIHFVGLKGMVETLDKPAYCIIDVYDDRIELKGFGREPSRTLPVHEAVPLGG